MTPSLDVVLQRSEDHRPIISIRMQAPMAERPLALPPAGGCPCFKSSPKKLPIVMRPRASAANARNKRLTLQPSETFSRWKGAGLCWHGAMKFRSGFRISRRSEEHTSELQSHSDLVCRLLLEKKKKK